METSGEEENKLPLKRVELSLSKFNEVAIPHHLDLLRQHKANIIKYGNLGEYGRVRVEQGAARRAAQRLRALLSDLDALRRAVRAADRAAFDARAAKSIADTRAAIADYTESSPLLMREYGDRSQAGVVAGSVTSSESVGVVREGEGEGREDEGREDEGREDEGREDEGREGEVRLQVDATELALREREDALRGWQELQEEVGALHETWRALDSAARLQAEPVARTEESVARAAADVAEARTQLALGERWRAGGAAVGGAALGALAGGPVGLLVGLKAGAAAALAGSLLGYAAGRLYPPRAALALPAPPAAPPAAPHSKTD